MNGIIKQGYFVPEGTPLNTQLIQFQRHQRRTGLVVDEYGDILGLVTLEDIFREIVGEFTANLLEEDKDIHPQTDGSSLLMAQRLSEKSIVIITGIYQSMVQKQLMVLY